MDSTSLLSARLKMQAAEMARKRDIFREHVALQSVQARVLCGIGPSSLPFWKAVITQTESGLVSMEISHRGKMTNQHF